MKKILAMLMIVFLMVGTVYAGSGFFGDGGYLHNTQSDLIRGYLLGVVDVTLGVGDVDKIVQVKYSKNFEEVNVNVDPDLDPNFVDAPTLVEMLEDGYETEDYSTIELTVGTLLDVGPGHAQLHVDYYSESTTSGPFAFDRDDPTATNTTPGAIVYIDDSGEYRGPFKHSLSYKVVYITDELELFDDDVTVTEPIDTIENEWKVLQVSEKTYGWKWVDIGEGEFGYRLTEILGLSDVDMPLEEYIPAPTPGLGKYKVKKDHPNKDESTPSLAPAFEGDNGNKNGHEFAPGQNKDKPVNYGQKKNDGKSYTPGENGKHKGNK